LTRRSAKSEYLYNYIRQAVDRGDYASRGFPGERALSRQTGLSLTTVRKAVARAVAEGLLRKVPNTRKIQSVRRRGRAATVLRILMLLPSPPRYGHTQWCFGLERVAEAQRHRLEILLYTDESDTNLWGTLGSKNHDLIFLVPPHSPNKVVLDRIKRNSHRLIVLFEDYIQHGVSSLRQVPFRAMDCLMDHLAAKGVRTVHCFNAEPANSGIKESISRWREGLKKHGLNGELVSGVVKPQGSIRKQALELAHDHLRGGTPLPDAFVTTTGSAAIALTRGLADFGLRAGLDVSVLACSSAVELQYTTPSITCIESPPIENLLELALDEFTKGRLSQIIHIEPPEFKILPGESSEREVLMRRAVSP